MAKPSPSPGLRSRLVPTAIGDVGLVFSDRGLARVVLPTVDTAATLRRAGASRIADDVAAEELAARVTAHLGGEDVDYDDIRLDDDELSPFARGVYAETRRIPRGTTSTYAELAAKVNTVSARAIGVAMGRNPHPIVTPCHRVVGAHDSGGFSAPGGTSTKATLLTVEGGSLDDEEHTRARRHLSRVDPVLAPLIRAIPCPLPIAPRGELFRTLARAIAGQQLSVKAAATIFGRVAAKIGEADPASFGPDAPAKVHATSADELRSVGLSHAKAAALHDLARRVLEKSLPLERVARMPDERVVEALCEVRGIGRWTVEMLLIFELGRPDVMPVADLGVRKGAQKLFRLRSLPSPAALLRRAEAWRPFRSIGAWYLWRALDTPLPA